jgi:hypothetical protein
MPNICKNDIEFFKGVFDAYDAFRSQETHKESYKALAKKLNVTLQAFLAEPRKIVERKIQAIKSGKIQAVGVSTDFTKLVGDPFNVTIEADNFDLGWQQAFTDMSAGLFRGRLTWTIYNVANGLTFNKVEEGQRIQVDSISGTSVQAECDYYGGALGWTDKMIEARQIPAMIDIASVFRNQFWVNKADNHYLLLSTAGAIAGQTTAAQGAAADGQLRRNIKTINQAAFNLTNRLKDKGYGDMASAPLILYANPLDEAIIEAAFRARTAEQSAALRGAEQITSARPIQRIYTYTTRITRGFPLLVLPGRKSQRADYRQPTTYRAPKDVLTLNEVQAVWAIYGAAVADSEQVETVTLTT